MTAPWWTPTQPPPPITAVIAPTLVGEELQVSVGIEQTLTVTQARCLARQIIAAAEWAAAENTKTIDTLRGASHTKAGATA
ncbi:hypothetical protein NB037_03200 [Rathayibacter sp. ZW T2_19]|uniref:Uncharacterized protein n=1 Tax=Rathayibacter rubneri TaxID=2950106 RepID=A0A9X2DUJ0_9MICO|nr:hypothetical protein [Rathayibacter rubneri]MCM6761415.1 hypothetical protein [Rathayibacter rubneri]